MKLFSKNTCQIICFFCVLLFSVTLSAAKSKETFKLDLVEFDAKLLEEPSGDVVITGTFPRELTRVEHKIIQRKLDSAFDDNQIDVIKDMKETNEDIKAVLHKMEQPGAEIKALKKKLDKEIKQLQKQYAKEKKKALKEVKKVMQQAWYNIVENNKQLKKSQRKKLLAGLKITAKILGGTFAIAITVVTVIGTIAGTSWNPGAPASIIAIIAGSASILASSMAIVSGIKDVVKEFKAQGIQNIKAQEAAVKAFLESKPEEVDKWKKNAKKIKDSHSQALSYYRVQIAKIKNGAEKFDKQIDKERAKIEKLEDEIKLVQKGARKIFAWTKKAKMSKKETIAKVKELRKKQDDIEEKIKDMDKAIDDMIDKILDMEKGVDQYAETAQAIATALDEYENANPSSKIKILAKISKKSGISVENINTLLGILSTIATSAESVTTAVTNIVKAAK